MMKLRCSHCATNFCSCDCKCKCHSKMWSKNNTNNF